MLAALLNNQTMVINQSWAVYHRPLLETARTLLAEGRFGHALTQAHTAAEVFTERVFVAWFNARGIQELERPVRRLMPGYNLCNTNVRQLYTALTGDKIAEPPQAFWQALKTSRELREDFVHGGAIITREQAEAAAPPWPRCWTTSSGSASRPTPDRHRPSVPPAHDAAGDHARPLGVAPAPRSARERCAALIHVQGATA